MSGYKKNKFSVISFSVEITDINSEACIHSRIQRYFFQIILLYIVVHFQKFQGLS